MYKNSTSRKEKEEKINQLILEAENKIENYCNSEDELKEYLRFTASLHNYSYNNTALIQSQFPGAYAVGSFKFWNDKGFSVKKGESGIGILVPVRGKVKFLNESGEYKSIDLATPEEKRLIKSGEYKTSGGKTFYKIGYVFDITQTTAKKEDLPKIMDSFWLEGEVKNYSVFNDAIKEFAKEKNISIKTNESEMGNVRGTAAPEKGEIFLNKRNSELQNIKTEFHEIGHVMMHNGSGSMLETSEKEFQAELVAYTVCAYFGIDTTDYSFPYIRGWTKNKTLNDKKALLKGVTTTAHEIISHVESYLIDHKEEALKDPTNIENYIMTADEVKETNKRKNEKEVTLTVAECGEYHNLGEFHEGITTVEHAISLFKRIPPERMNGVKSIGVNIHTLGTESYEDVSIDVLSGNTFDLEVLDYISDIKNNEQAVNLISELISKMPEMNVLGSLPGKDYVDSVKSAVVVEFEKKTEKYFHSIDGKTPEDIKNLVKEYIDGIKESNNLDFTIKNLVVSGSRCRGLENESSDIDIVFEYKGNITEDTLFNYLHEDNYELNGIQVDINPITESKTGTLDEYLPGVESYLKDKKNELEMVEHTEKVSSNFKDKSDAESKGDTVKIEDFGKKIGGAKKDLWKERGLAISDLDEMNAAEKEKFVKKDNVWKKPDYNKLISEGMPIHVAYFMKKVRDSISTSPEYHYLDKTEESRKNRQNDYIEMITDIKNMLEDVKNDSDICNFYKRFANTGKYIVESPVSRYHVDLTEKGKQVTNKLLKAIQENSVSVSRYDREIEKKQFGKASEEKIPAGYEIHLYDGKGYTTNDDWKVGTYYITKKYSIIDVNIETYEAALKKVKEAAKKPTSGRKKKFRPEQLQHIKRIGPDNGMEEGKTTGEQYLDKFGFLGGEFGNWMTENDRQSSLDLGYDALCDMARALNIDDKDVSLGNRLSIAFGSRGSGNALAHYEPLREVINLTKMRGAGSLAHEWGHAFDDIIGKENELKVFMSESKKIVLDSMKELIDTMKYRESTPEEMAEYTKKDIERSIKRLDSWVNSYVPDEKLTDKEKQLKEEIRNEMILEAKEGKIDHSFILKKEGDAALDHFNSFVKQVTKHVIPKEGRGSIYYNLSALESSFSSENRPRKEKTEYYKNSITFDSMCSKEDKGYWQSSTEMFARAFACYVYDKLEAQGIRNDYLCGHANSAITVDFSKEDAPLIKAYPEGEERKKINKCMDHLFKECLEKEIFREPINCKMNRNRGR